MRLEAVDLFLRVAGATVGAPEIGANAGPYVERILKLTGLPAGNPWCAAWVADVGVQAFSDAWPLPRTASCYALGEHAKKHSALLDPLTEPVKRGDLFLIYFASLNRFAHVGVVAAALGGRRIATIEGNTNADGGREGWLVARRERSLGPKDRLIRWTGLLTPETT